jgi:hypothetical protein
LLVEREGWGGGDGGGEKESEMGGAEEGVKYTEEGVGRPQRRRRRHLPRRGRLALCEGNRRPPLEELPAPAPLALQRARWRDVHRLGGQGRHKRARPLRLARRSGRSARTRWHPPPSPPSESSGSRSFIARGGSESAASAGGKSSGGNAACAGVEMCLRTRRRGRGGWVGRVRASGHGGGGAGGARGRAEVRASRWAMQTRDLVYKRGGARKVCAWV